MMKRLILLFAGIVCCMGMALAQTTVQGVVISEEDGEPVIGASVKVEGSNEGTVTDVDGRFTLSVPEKSRLTISYLGMASQTVAAASQMNIVLTAADKALDEVVVTAMGLSRQKKALGYAMTDVKGDEMMKSRGGTSNPINALQGKVAGLNISSNSGSMGGSSKILLRGANSLSGSNQPLFVVDGVPIEGGDYNSATTQRGGSGYDYGNLIQDINPDDIETLSVLKGAAATALYGSRASNGVIMITTKRAKDTKGLGVEFTSSIGFESVIKLPKLQNQYGAGQGYAGDYGHSDEGDDFGTITINGKTYTTPNYSMDESWGPRLDGREVLSWYDYLKWIDGGRVGDPTTSTWIPTTSDYHDFFETGVSLTNNVAVSQQFEGGSLRVSYTNNTLSGYVPGSSQQKNILNVNGEIASRNKKLHVFTSVNYFNNRTKGRPERGYGSANVMTSFTQFGQVQLNVKELRDLYKMADGTQASWCLNDVGDHTQITQNNPYWNRYMNYETDSRNRVYGNVGFSYQLLPQLKMQYKANLDFFVDKQYERIAVYSQQQSKYNEVSRQQYEINHELMLMYSQTFGQYSLSANVGGNLMRSHYECLAGYTQGGLAIPEFYSLQNSVNTPYSSNYVSRKAIHSLFGDVTLGWKNMLYVEATLRGDRSSTLPKNHNTYVYPSLTASWLFSELLKNKAPWLTYGKLRLGLAKVGNDTDPYQVISTYEQYTNVDNSTPGYTLSSQLNNADLKPESTTSVEAGLEMSFLGGRLGFDLTLYKTNSKDQILPLSISGTTGYTTKVINAGEIENKGIELALHATPVSTHDFEWNTSLTLASNKNKVKSLADGVDYYKIVAAPYKVEIGAQVGGEYGIIMGSDFVYDENGNKCVDPETGLYMATDGSVPLGKIYPDFTGGWSNSFRYKNWNMSVLFDFSKGGHFFSNTYLFGFYSGMLEETVADGIREKGIVCEGVVYGTGEKNTKRVSARDYFKNYYTGPAAQCVLSSDYIKLREITIGYTFHLKPQWFIKSLRLSAYGRNLAVWGPDVKHFDPETCVTSSGNVQGIEGATMPMVASYGLTVNLKF